MEKDWDLYYKRIAFLLFILGRLSKGEGFADKAFKFFQGGNG
jgi:hypothetical protein